MKRKFFMPLGLTIPGYMMLFTSQEIKNKKKSVTIDSTGKIIEKFAAKEQEEDEEKD